MKVRNGLIILLIVLGSGPLLADLPQEDPLANCLGDKICIDEITENFSAFKELADRLNCHVIEGEKYCQSDASNGPFVDQMRSPSHVNLNQIK